METKLAQHSAMPFACHHGVQEPDPVADGPDFRLAPLKGSSRPARKALARAVARVRMNEMSGNTHRIPDASGGATPMSAVAPSQPPIPAPDPGWIPSPLYRMTVEEYEAMVESGGLASRATGSISSTGTWWPR